MPRKLSLHQLVSVALILLTAGCISSRNVPAEASNSLAVGSLSRAAGPVSVPLNGPAEFNWKKREEILNMRRAAIARTPQLLAHQYQPTEDIFEQVEDGKPWWGFAGECVYGKGMASIKGFAEESRFVLNPFMLVACNPATLGIWNTSKLNPDQMNDPRFPFYWMPESLVYKPKEQTAELTYNISNYLRAVSAQPALATEASQLRKFSLVAYNARDMGYNFIYLDTKKSKDVENDNHPHDATFIGQFIHCGGTCGYAGGCNNMSPFIAEIDRCRLNKLPASAVIYLWKERPESVESKPDFTYYITFK
jgi:hypothetical protein